MPEKQDVLENGLGTPNLTCTGIVFKHARVCRVCRVCMSVWGAMCLCVQLQVQYTHESAFIGYPHAQIVYR